MEFELQTSNTSPPCDYVTAPTSPNEYNSLEFYYSAPASPRRKPADAIATNGDHLSSNLDDFEFETSKKFSGCLQFESNGNFFEYDQGQEGKKYLDRGDSLPSMAFADQLFLNGLVMPLKLPPRLQYDNDFNSFSQKSPFSSPRTVCKIPFSRRSSWNDDFDPFMVALEKVREEKRGRNSHHRRSRSYSPFRAITKCSSDCNEFCDHGFPKGNSPIEPMQVKAPSFSGPLDFKGSAYARWVRDQTREGLSPKSPKRFLVFGQRVRPLRTDQDGPMQSKEKFGRKRDGNVEGKSKLQKLKGFLLRYASFGKENRGSKKMKMSSEIRKPSYYSRLSFKAKDKNQKKKMNDDKNMAVIEYKPSRTISLGYGVESPREVK